MGDRKPRTRRSNSEGSSSSSSSTSSFSSDEETDARDLKPIRGYLSNRRELARQLFKSVKNEKIRMMLPQILKNMNLNNLEEWCASELCGMSEARIISIVNGQPMLDSSDTSESDDSGPSLEIISDTEEWLTDTDVAIKEEPSSSGAGKSRKIKVTKAKRKNPLGKKSEIDKQRAKTKGKTTGGPAIESDVKVKKEKEKDNRTATNKEGESLLDLLELEMRARAIRALIRKEEDIIPSAASEKRMAMTANALRNTLNSAVSASLSSEKSLNGKFSLGDSAANDGEKKSSAEPARSGETAELVEDEDVVFVVAQPTPTIELLSSDNDEENGNETKRDKKKETTSVETANARHSKNDKIPEAATIRDSATTTTSNERIVTIDKTGDGPDSLKIVITKRLSESSGSPSPSKSGKSRKNLGDRVDKSVVVTSDKTAVAEAEQSGKGLFKKIKRKQHLRSKRKATTEESSNERETAEKSANAVVIVAETEISADSKTVGASPGKPAESGEKEIPESSKLPEARVVKLEAAESKEPRAIESASKVDERQVKRKAKRRIVLDEDRPDDFEEIIDLDNYSDDMDDMENSSDAKSTGDDCAEAARLAPVEGERKSETEDAQVTKEQTESSETWATRYYQTDDVQNVIKESKIQSEIRKRLRERQRQSKLSSSPKPNSPADGTAATDKIEEKPEAKPTGSVQEYLALKNATASNADDTNAAVVEDKKLPADTSDLSDEKSTPAPGEIVAVPSASNSGQETATAIMTTATPEVQ